MNQALAALDSVEALAALRPAFRRSLIKVFDVEALAGRLCPVLLEDGCVAIFLLAEYAQADQVQEVERLVRERGYRLAQPSRRTLSAPLLLAVTRERITAGTLRGCRNLTAPTPASVLAELFHDLVRWGVRHGASDLHLNVQRAKPESEVRYTVAGVYVAPELFRLMPTSTLTEILSVAWMRVRGGNGAVFDPSIEQQGRLSIMIDDQPIMLRWASLATDAGPSVCLRILRPDSAAPLNSLDELGYLPSQIDMLERARLAEGGAVVLAGTVGSGKSTTIATLMRGIASGRKVITLEDPVEYPIAGALQNTVGCTLEEAAGPVFGAKLRTLKRSAMDDLLIGEIRDVETGLAFSDLAGSGVSLYTTTHTSSAWMIPERLASVFIGVARDLLATPGILKLLVYQTLLPRLCQRCALPLASLDSGAPGADGAWRDGWWWRHWRERLLRFYEIEPAGLRVANPAGCDDCRRVSLPALYGTRGRTVAAEIIEPTADDAFLECVRRGDNLALRRHVRSQARSARSDADMRGKSALDCALYKASIGVLDPRAIESRFLSLANALRGGTPHPKEAGDA